ncbi:hypothetical protein [Novosphingobium rosa]|uniref:hypothetical protein n=1 Tax=Novosphingobium rosa TaxID=76978 RepID=UPI000837915B|nr:hypothetical protein [Novosphingobium rosa]
MRALLTIAGLLVMVSGPLQANTPLGRPAAPGPQPAVPVPAVYLTNSVVCHDPATGATCQLMLEADGRYIVVINRGQQPQMPSIDGPWQIEGRTGHYKLRRPGGATQLCLQPDNGSGSYDSERAGELFAGAGCYPFTLHALGERWNETDSQGRVNTLWLVAGR